MVNFCEFFKFTMIFLHKSSERMRVIEMDLNPDRDTELVISKGWRSREVYMEIVMVL